MKKKKKIKTFLFRNLNNNNNKKDTKRIREWGGAFVDRVGVVGWWIAWVSNDKKKKTSLKKNKI